MEPNRYYLVNLYDGDTQAVFDNADQLVDYLKRTDKAGALMGEAAFSVFLGRQLRTENFWEAAFGKGE